MITSGSSLSRSSSRIGFAVFLVATLALLFYVKWDPYFAKSLKAAATHTLGPSIVSGTSAAAPAFSVQAAIQYGIAYGLDIWEALVAGLLLGAGVQVLLPRDWLRRLLGKRGLRSSLIGGAASVPSMM